MSRVHVLPLELGDPQHKHERYVRAARGERLCKPCTRT